MSNPIEDKVREILRLGSTKLSEEQVIRKMVELVGDEKSTAYSLGFVDGERRMKPTGRVW